MLDMKRAELAAILADEEADLRNRVLREPHIRLSRVTRRLQLERELAAATGEEYAEELPLDHVIGYEWHIVSNNARHTVVLCGDVGRETSVLFYFNYTELFRVSAPGNDSGVFSYGGNGLGVYGLYVVQNSTWRREMLAARSQDLFNYDESWWSTFQHFILRGKDCELSCLARGYECRLLSEGIESIRERAAFWEKL
ncbi:MAG: hypothetical protein ABJE95_22590 [Byssovorax sp.]